MLRAEIDVQILISTVRFHFRKVITLIHATSESTFRFCQRTNSYADKLDLYYKGAIDMTFACTYSTRSTISHFEVEAKFIYK